MIKRVFLLTFTLSILFFTSEILRPNQESPFSAEPETTMAITITQVNKGLWPENVVATGSIAPWQEAIVSTEIEGHRIVAILVDVGDRVEKGQILAQFNLETLLAEKTELYASWMQAEANAQRAIPLMGSGAMSQHQIDSYVSAEALAKAKLDTKELQIQQALVRAPDAGIISARNATLGTVGNNGQELFRLIRQERLEWRGALTAEQIQKMSPGLEITLELPDGTKANAKIRHLAPALDPKTRMATLYADINSKGTARAGMFAEGQIHLSKTSALFIPAECVVIRDGHSYVFRVETDAPITKVIQQKVMTGRRYMEHIEITHGLDEGMLVAHKGSGFLYDGDPVSVVKQKSTIADAKFSETTGK